MATTVADVMVATLRAAAARNWSKIGPAILSQLFSARLVQRMASCEPAARLSATRSASPRTWSRGTALLTRPIRSASAPVIISPVSR
jgi:hypothetical protein